MKKIIALIGAFAMAVSMAVVANAEILDKGVSVVYDVAESTPDKAIIKVYAKGYATNVSNVNVRIPVSSQYIDYTNTKSYNVMTGGTAMANAPAAAQKLMLTFAGVGGGAFGDNGLVGYFECPLTELGKTTAFDIIPEYAHVKDSGVTYIFIGNGSGTKVSDEIATDSVPVRTSATVAGTTISKDANSDPATYFKVVGAPLVGTDVFWYADFAGTAKKLAANVPNTVGTADLGLVYTGADAPTSVKIVCE